MILVILIETNVLVYLKFKNYCHVNSKDRIVILVNTKEIIVNDIANDLPCKQIVAQR